MNRPFKDNKRKQILIAGGLSYVFIGLSYVVDQTESRAQAFQWLPDAVTPERLGWLWIVGGLAVLICTLISQTRAFAQSLAFTLLAVCPAIWAAVFIGGTVFGTHPKGWISSVLYGVLVVWSMIMAGWDNPSRDNETAKEPPATGGVSE